MCTEAEKAFDFATYKQPADKIRQNLSKIYNNPASSAKRWVWELIQNAKDVPNRFGKVSIEIDLDQENKLVFKHNGDPFKINNIIGLIRQVSSKDSLNNDEETTGKFGTGFICTHILSDVIDINGVLDYSGCRKFDLRLDRTGRSSEELIPRIKEVETKFRDPEKNFLVVNDYESCRQESDLDTSFTYFLSTIEKQEAAKNGIDDLVNTLPITLVTQSKKIKQVRVVDIVHNSDVIYTCSSQNLDSNVKYSIVNINDTKRFYLTYETAEVALTIEVSPESGGYTLIGRDSKQPVLYRDFPLIGSEKFYFPYTLNGFRLYPTEKRNSLPLNGEDNYEAKENRSIIDHAVDAAISFNQWLIDHNAKNRYLLASSRRPKAEIEYDDRIAMPWIKALQTSWRSKLLDQQLAETNEGRFQLREISVPSFAGYGEKEAKNTNEAFYSLLVGFYLGGGHLPLKGHYNEWLNIIRPEYDSWGATLKYEKEDFLTDLAGVKTISSLCAKLNKSRAEVVGWLNRVYQFLVSQNCLSDFDRYAIIPNMEGNFMLLKELLSDSSNPIPQELMNLYNHVMPTKREVNMMAKDVECAIFGNTLQVFDLSDMIDWINTKIKSSEVYTCNGTLYYANFWLVYRLISFYPNDSTDDKYKSYRQKMYDISASDSNQGEFKALDVADTNLWREADNYWFDHSYKKIEKYETVTNFAKDFFANERTVEEALLWLDDYYEFFRENSRGDFLKDKKIFPTQNLIFRPLKELRYDGGVEESFKDLAKYAFSEEKYRQVLLHSSIKGYEQHNPLTLKEVYEFIKVTFDKSSWNIRDVIAKHAIAIIPKTSSEDGNDTSSSPEMKLYEFVKAAFGDSIPNVNYVTNAAGFNWGFAYEFYLTNLCAKVAKSVNVKELKASSSYFSDYTDLDMIKWVDSLIEFLHSYKNKKYWPIITDAENGAGIWINQNCDFCRFQEIHKDNNISEELKDLAANNRIVAHDFRAELFTPHSACDSYLETPPIGAEEVGESIDDKIKEYQGNKQDKDFAALVFTVGKLCSLIPDLIDYMPYYKEKKNSLIVGSLGEGKTLDLIGSFIQQGPEKLERVKNVLDAYSDEDLKLLQNCPADKQDKVKELIRRMANGEDVNITEESVTPEIKVEDFEGKLQTVTIDHSQYSGLSLDEIESYVAEAKRAVVKYFKELNEKRPELGYTFDEERIKKDSFSQLYGIYDKNGNEIPIVVHSYKGPQYRYFDLNWYDWQLLSKEESMLFVLTVTGLQCVPLYALPVRNVNIPIEDDMSNEDRAALLTLSAVGKRYSTAISFDFGNNMPQSFNAPVTFNHVPEKLRQCIANIEDVCDQNILEISNIYNNGRSIPIKETPEGYSAALENTGEEKARDIFEAPADDTKAPSVGTTHIE